MQKIDDLLRAAHQAGQTAFANGILRNARQPHFNEAQHAAWLEGWDTAASRRQRSVCFLNRIMAAPEMLQLGRDMRARIDEFKADLARRVRATSGYIDLVDLFKGNPTFRSTLDIHLAANLTMEQQITTPWLAAILADDLVGERSLVECAAALLTASGAEGSELSEPTPPSTEESATVEPYSQDRDRSKMN